MNRKSLFLTLIGGISIGFVLGLISYNTIPFGIAQEKKKKDPIVLQLEEIEDAISDRNSPVVEELESITEELEGMKQELKNIERNLDE
jgi:hypothetical protein